MHRQTEDSDGKKMRREMRKPSQKETDRLEQKRQAMYDCCCHLIEAHAHAIAEAVNQKIQQALPELAGKLAEHIAEEVNQSECPWNDSISKEAERRDQMTLKEYLNSNRSEAVSERYQEELGRLVFNTCWKEMRPYLSACTDQGIREMVLCDAVVIILAEAETAALMFSNARGLLQILHINMDMTVPDFLQCVLHTKTRYR